MQHSPKPVFFLFLIFFVVLTVEAVNQSFPEPSTEEMDTINEKVYRDTDFILLSDSLKTEIENNNRPEIIRLCSKIGRKYYENETYDLAIKYYLQGLKISDEYNQTDGNSLDLSLMSKLTGIIEMNIADVYAKMLNYEIAIGFFQKAAKQFHLLKDTSWLMKTMNGLGLAYNSISRHDSAVATFLDLYKIAQCAGDSIMIAGAINNIGLVEFDNGNFEPAHKNFVEAGKIYHRLGILRKEAATLYNIGLLQGYAGNYDSTIVFFQKALALLNAINDFNGMIKVQVGIAQYYFTKSNFDKSEEFLNKALKNSHKTGAVKFVIDIYSHLADLMAESGRYDEAFNYLKIHQQKRDSVYFRHQEKISEMQSRYENEKKEREIEMLGKENQIKDLTLQKQQNQKLYLIRLAIVTLIALLILFSRYRLKIRTNKKLNIQKRQLEDANATKDKFFSIIAHDLKNTVHSTCNFSYALYHDFARITEKQQSKIISGIYTSSHQTSKLLENLLQWAILQNGKPGFNPEKCNLDEIIKNEISLANAYAEKRNIRIGTFIPENLIAFADRNMTALVVRNLLSNAINFSPEGTHITVHGGTQNGFVEIAVRDQGEGILPGDIPKLFRTDVNLQPVSMLPPICLRQVVGFSLLILNGLYCKIQILLLLVDFFQEY